MKLFAASSLLVVAVMADNDAYPLTNSRSIDGSEEQNGRGAANVPLKRLSYADYPDDNMKKDKYPNPRDISNIIHKQPDGDSITNKRDLSDMIWAFGQLLDHDIDLTEGDSDSGAADIECPANKTDDILSGHTMPFTRAKMMDANATTRDHPNQITAYVDASFVYGSDHDRAKALRSGINGELTMSAKGTLLPKNKNGFPNAGGDGQHLFFCGDIRCNEQVGLIAMHTLFVREHNRLCKKIRAKYKDATDEQIYQLARKIVGAEMQMITYKEFLPAVLGPFAPDMDSYEYSEDVDPGICTEFSSAAYRFGHSMLSPFLQMSDGKKNEGEVALRDAYFNPKFFGRSVKDNKYDKKKSKRIDHLIGGFVTQESQEIDRHCVEDVRSFLFQKETPEEGGHDLAAFNIQRGRDVGIPGYNDVRKAYNLTAADGYGDISSDPAIQGAFVEAYGDSNMAKVDLWTAGLSEDHVEGASCGETLGTIIGEQFTRLMNGDPYFYLRDPDLTSKKLKGIINLDKFSFAYLIRRNTKVKGIKDDQNVFFVKKKKAKSPRQPKKLKPQSQKDKSSQEATE